jgi:CofD-related protein of GAK system
MSPCPLRSHDEHSSSLAGRKLRAAAPEEGPRILFLTGGTALRDASRALTAYTHNSIHLVTPFDSGGSSAALRAAFGMLSVGDLRNRLLALADDTSPETRALRGLMAHRLDPEAPAGGGRARLAGFVGGRDPLFEEVAAADRAFVRDQLGSFARQMPDDFDLRGASIGNLILAGGYLEDRDIGAVVRDLSARLRVRGRVLPSVDADLHLEAQLVDGSRIVGQHRLTGKEHPPLSSAVAELRLVSTAEGGEPAPVRPEASAETIRLIREADLICYPMGSFYSSLVCNLLPSGIGAAIAAAPCPKVYVPSTGHDPELVGVDPGRAAERLIETLRRDAGSATPVRRLLDRVLLDHSPASYPIVPDLARLEALGVDYDASELVTEDSFPRIDAERLARALVALAAPRPNP